MKIKFVFYDKEKHGDTLKKLNEEFDFRRYLNVRGGDIYTPEEGRDYINVVAVSANKKIVYGFCFSEHYGDGSVQVKSVYVLEKYRGKGIAGKLLKEIENRILNSWKVPELYGFTLENKTMEKIFMDNGYNLMGVFKRFAFVNGRYHDQSFFAKYF